LNQSKKIRDKGIITANAKLKKDIFQNGIWVLLFDYEELRKIKGYENMGKL
jgi:hypothetical protein